MHKTLRTLLMALTPGLAVAVLLPAGAGLTGLVTLDARHEAADELRETIDDAVRGYRSGQTSQRVKTKAEQEREEAKRRIAELAKEKRLLRLQMAQVKGDLDALRAELGIDSENPDVIARLARIQKREFLRLVKNAYVASGPLAVAGNTDALSVMLDALQSRFGAQDARMAVLEKLETAADAARTLDGLRKQHEDVARQYRSESIALDRAESLIGASDAQIEENKKIIAEVHAQILKLQSEIARIDARLKSKAERELLEKGLMAPKTGGDKSAIEARPPFTWPVYGPVSAPFMSASYKKYFGVNHYGADLVVAQGTEVYAAARGIVFVVRDGGEFGYSYLLIGHSDGYATLYGHMSEMTVAAGQEVQAGQVIGLSGGTPGTHGAGPMTTAAHLHFEVIQGGVNVDPMSVLP